MYKIYFSSLFAISILLSSLIHFPVLIVRPFNSKNTALYLKILRFFSRILLPIKFKSTGYDYTKNHTPSIMISNHQSSFDMIWAAYCLEKNIVALGKYEILYLPIFGLNFILSGNILIKRGNRESRLKAMAKIKEKLEKENISIVIFPEGHRNQSLQLLKFKDGAFRLAKEMNLPIIPFVIEPYVKKIGIKKEFELKILPPISSSDVQGQELKRLKEKCSSLIQNEINNF